MRAAFLTVFFFGMLLSCTFEKSVDQDACIRRYLENDYVLKKTLSSFELSGASRWNEMELLSCLNQDNDFRFSSSSGNSSSSQSE